MNRQKNDLADRCSNLELLRIVAMMMIVIYHIVYHCVIAEFRGGGTTIKISNTLFNHPLFYKKIVLIDEIMTFGPVGNAIFLLISGYFMVIKEKAINLTQIAKRLLLQLGFASVVLVVGSALIFKYDGGANFLSLIDINSFNLRSWYVGYYFLIILMAALFLNRFLSELDNQKYTAFLTATFAIIQFGWTGSILEGIGSGLRTVATGIFLYSFGGYIRIYEPFKKVRMYVFFLLLFVIGSLIFISSYNITQTNIENFYLNTPDGTFVQGYMSYGNHSIIVILMGTCIFEIFKRIKMPRSKIINFIGKGTFMVYLIHDNVFFYSLWGLKDWIVDLYHTPIMFLLNLLKWGSATFAVGMIVYVGYLSAMNLYDTIKWVFIKG